MRGGRSGRRWWRAIAAVLTCVVLAGCATRPPGTLRFGMEDAPEGKRLSFPPPPEVPRYSFGGQLLGEQNFVFDRGQENVFQTFLRVLTGLGAEPPVELVRPQGVVSDAKGRIYVTDVGQPSVRVFDPAAGRLHVWTQAFPGRGFLAPIGIAVGASGTVYVADSEYGVVAQLNAQGEPLAPLGLGKLERPTGLVLDEAGNRLFVSDTRAADIKVFDLEGNLLAILGKAGDGPGEFNGPTYLAYRQGELYVADTLNARVQVIDAETGAFRRLVGTRGLTVGELVRPKGVALDGDGNLYVVESYHDHMLVYNGEGQFLMGIGGEGFAAGRFYLPAGIWVDGGNRIFMADMMNGRVVVFHFLGGD